MNRLGNCYSFETTILTRKRILVTRVDCVWCLLPIALRFFSQASAGSIDIGRSRRGPFWLRHQWPWSLTVRSSRLINHLEALVVGRVAWAHISVAWPKRADRELINRDLLGRSVIVIADGWVWPRVSWFVRAFISLDLTERWICHTPATRKRARERERERETGRKSRRNLAGRSMAMRWGSDYHQFVVRVCALHPFRSL